MVKWNVGNWIQCKCVFILIKSVMKHFVGCVTISHNNRFNFKHVSRYFFSYCRVNPYFPEKLNDVATIRSFVQIFYFSINSTKSVLIDKMDVLFQNPLYCFSSANPGGVCVSVPTKTGLSLNTNRHCALRGERQVAAIMDYLTTFHTFSLSWILKGLLPRVWLLSHSERMYLAGVSLSHWSVVIFPVSQAPLIYHLCSVQSYSIKQLKYFNEN